MRENFEIKKNQFRDANMFFISICSLTKDSMKQIINLIINCTKEWKKQKRVHTVSWNTFKRIRKGLVRKSWENMSTLHICTGNNIPKQEVLYSRKAKWCVFNIFGVLLQRWWWRYLKWDPTNHHTPVWKQPQEWQI